LAGCFFLLIFHLHIANENKCRLRKQLWRFSALIWAFSDFPKDLQTLQALLKRAAKNLQAHFAALLRNYQAIRIRFHKVQSAFNDK
jgi:hypothetical protein